MLSGNRYFYGSPWWVLKMLIRHRPDGWVGWIRAFKLLLASLAIWPGLWIEKTFLGRKIWNQAVPPEPIIILGQARSGTTLLFKLLSSNSRWTYIDGMDLYFPYWPPALRRLMTAPLQYLIKILGIKKLHFHNYDLRLSDPLEEDTQYCFGLSPFSAYWGIIWAKRAEELMNATIQFKAPKDKEIWKAAYLYGLKRIAYYRPNRKLVLKSPSSTGRVAALLEIFPDAKFIHISRNPAEIFRSLEQLATQVLFAKFSMQTISKSEIRELLIQHYQLLDANFRRDKHLIPKSQLCEVTYNEIMQDSLGSIRRIFSDLKLEGWAYYEPELQIAIEKEARYVPNSQAIPNHIQELVANHFPESCQEWEEISAKQKKFMVSPSPL